MKTDRVVRDMGEGSLEAFENVKNFLSKFNPGGLFEHLKNTAPEDCIRYFCRFYAQKHSNFNLQKAYNSLQQRDFEQMKSYLEKAGTYFKLSSNSS